MSITNIKTEEKLQNNIFLNYKFDAFKIRNKTNDT